MRSAKRWNSASRPEKPQPWYENLLSATPTLEMGVDIGDLSSVLLCAVPPNQASFLQRIGRAGRRDGNAMTTTLADGNSPHDLYFFEQTHEMLAGEVTPPGVFLRAAEVLRRQLFAFCLDDWVGSGVPVTALPDETSRALDALARKDTSRFPFTFLDHVLTNEPGLLQAFLDLLGADLDAQTQQRLRDFMRGTDEVDSLRVRLSKALEELLKERQAYQKRALQLRKQIDTLKARPQDEATQHEIDSLQRERQSALELISEINQRELLRTLTDAGLIPNYAFPEAGIELKSVLWRRRTAEDRGEGPLPGAAGHHLRTAGRLSPLRVCPGKPLLRQPAPGGGRSDQHGAGEPRDLAPVPVVPPHAEPDGAGRCACRLPTLW